MQPRRWTWGGFVVVVVSLLYQNVKTNVLTFGKVKVTHSLSA